MKYLLLPILCLSLASCKLDVLTGVTDAMNRPYPCQEGQIDGPGIIGGPRIKGEGRLAKGVVFLFQSLSVGSKTGAACTGSLIGDNMVLTAAHCVIHGDSSTREERTMLVFDHDPICSITKNNTALIRKVERIEIYPEYNGKSSVDGDLALIRFTGKAPDGSKPLKMASSFVSVADDATVYAAGYGKTVDMNDSGGEINYLRLAQIKMQNQSPNFGILNNPASKRLLFDQRGDQSLCQGDSGGPALVYDSGQLVVIGVASYVADPNARATCKSFVVHSSVAYFNDWLAKTYDRLANRNSSENPFRIAPSI